MRIVAEIAAILIAFVWGFHIGVQGLIRMAREEKRKVSR
jgi:hypothetical protein